MRFGSGLCTAGSLVTKFVYPIEICPLSYRTAVGVLCNIFIGIGALLLTLIAYLILDWRYLMLAITIPGITPLIVWRYDILFFLHDIRQLTTQPDQQTHQIQPT